MVCVRFLGVRRGQRRNFRAAAPMPRCLPFHRLYTNSITCIDVDSPYPQHTSPYVVTSDAITGSQFVTLPTATRPLTQFWLKPHCMQTTGVEDLPIKRRWWRQYCPPGIFPAGENGLHFYADPACSFIAKFPPFCPPQHRCFICLHSRRHYHTSDNMFRYWLA